MRDWRLYLVDMREFASRALRYWQGLEREVVFTDPMRLDAILRSLELLGSSLFCAHKCVHYAPFWYLLGLPWASCNLVPSGPFPRGSTASLS